MGRASRGRRARDGAVTGHPGSGGSAGLSGAAGHSGAAGTLRQPGAVPPAELDWATARRRDQGWLDRAWADPGTRVLVVEDGRALVAFGDAGASLVLAGPAQAPGGIRFLLGADGSGTAYFGVAAPLPAAPAGSRAAGLREAGPLLSGLQAGLLTQAVALANWHASHQYCPRCGTATRPALAGHSRVCPADGSEHFPRLDPAVIMLVTDPEDRCLLARNARWPERRVSILAGFVDAGESAEQAVAREVREETSIEVGDIRYVGSQPWPMPSSLMLGFRAQARGPGEIRVDGDEIASAGWYSRESLRTALASGEVLLPPRASIARRIIEDWYGAALPVP